MFYWTFFFYQYCKIKLNKIKIKNLKVVDLNSMLLICLCSVTRFKIHVHSGTDYHMFVLRRVSLHVQSDLARSKQREHTWRWSLSRCERSPPTGSSTRSPCRASRGSRWCDPPSPAASRTAGGTRGQKTEKWCRTELSWLNLCWTLPTACPPQSLCCFMWLHMECLLCFGLIIIMTLI